MDLSPELVLALLAYLPRGVLLIDLNQSEPTVFYANAVPAGAGGGLMGPRPLASLLGWPPGGAQMADFLLRVSAKQPVTLSVTLGDRPINMQLMPLPSPAGSARYLIGLEAVVPEIEQALPAMSRPLIVRDDRLTGLLHEDLFKEFFIRDFQIAARDKHALLLLILDIAALGAYNNTFGRDAGDGLIKMVGRALKSGLRRGSDLLARSEGGTFMALGIGQTPAQALVHAGQLAARVRDLHIHHPRSGVSSTVSLSIGLTHWSPKRDAGVKRTPEQMLTDAKVALQQSREGGRNRASLVCWPAD